MANTVETVSGFLERKAVEEERARILDLLSDLYENTNEERNKALDLAVAIVREL